MTFDYSKYFFDEANDRIEVVELRIIDGGFCFGFDDYGQIIVNTTNLLEIYGLITLIVS